MPYLAAAIIVCAFVGAGVYLAANGNVCLAAFCLICAGFVEVSNGKGKK